MSALTSLRTVRVGLCTTPQRQCAVCLCPLYIGKARTRRRQPGARTAASVTPKKRAEIFRATGFVLGKRQNLCGKCNETNIYALTFPQRYLSIHQIQIPEFLENVVQQELKQGERERERAEQSERKRRDPDNVPISINTLNESQIKYLSGLSLDNLHDIVNHVNAKKVTRSFKLDDLFIAGSVWKHNLSYRCAAILFGYAGHQGVKRVLDRVIRDLTRYWVQDHVGYGYWKDRNIADHQPIFVRRLHPDDNVVGIIDATYLYSQKSQRNYQYQKVRSFLIAIIAITQSHIFQGDLLGAQITEFAKRACCMHSRWKSALCRWTIFCRWP